MNSEEIIVARELTKFYRDFWGRSNIPALNGLNLSVRRGQIFGLLGPNGSGKTTTIKLLLGLLHPTLGTVALFGMPPYHIEARRRIGYLPEENISYGFLTARQTMRFFGALHSMSDALIEKRTDFLFSVLGLTEVRNRQVRKFSKGMTRKILLATALIHEPELLILDEPTAGLDPLSAKRVKELFLDLKRSGATILLSSHLLADVEDVCDSIAILDSGRLVESGTVSSLLTIKSQLEIRVQSDESKIQLLRDALKSAGAEVLSIRNPAISLEDLFVKTIVSKPSVVDNKGKS